MVPFCSVWRNFLYHKIFAFSILAKQCFISIEEVKKDVFRYGYINYTLYGNRVNLREEKNMQTSNADWITTKELAEIKGVSERAVMKKFY